LEFGTVPTVWYIFFVLSLRKLRWWIYKTTQLYSYTV